MKHLRKYAILLIFPLHLILFWLFVNGTPMDYFYLCAVVFVLLADFALSAWQTELFTSHRSRISQFAREFLPYLLQKLIVIAADWALLLILGRGDIFRSGLAFWGAVLFASIAALLSGLVTFVTGAARTMLYHDEKR